MRDPKAEASRWLDQAENDLAFARYALDGGFFHQACFVSQQCAEKAVKAVHYHEGARTVIGHSVVGLMAPLAGAHPELDALNDAAAELDLFCIPARYPNGLVDGTPHQVFTRAQAERALECAERIFSAMRSRLGR